MSNKPPFIPASHGAAMPSTSTNPASPAVTVPSMPGHIAQPPADNGAPKAMQVPAGASMYGGQSKELPTLPVTTNPVVMPAIGKNDKISMIAEGVNFVGNAQLSGVCSVGGKVEGNLVQSTGQNITVIVTESGYVKGDIVADNISVMGQTDGLLDAGGGSVALHDASRVSGHVRYNRLQVNGADLNATLEKANSKRERP
jgi:cytoskeletal protein CcmA (bactofilin family)